MSPTTWQLTMDTADPHAQADFWAAALHYDVENNSTLVQSLVDQGLVPAEATIVHKGVLSFRNLRAIRGDGRRILFQVVPEGKTVKNRLHLDLNVGTEQIFAEAERLTGLGATQLQEVDEPGTHHIVMADPEGNEFCVQ